MSDLSEWGVAEFTRKLPMDSVRFTTPEGFRIDLYQPTELVHLLMAMTLDVGQVQFSGSRFEISDGYLELIDSDAWDNKEFRYGFTICSKRELASVVGRYLLGKLNNGRS